MKRLLATLALVALVTSCGPLTQPGSDDALLKAADRGARLGGLACLAIVLKRPDDVPALREALAEMEMALTSPNADLSTFKRALGEIDDREIRLIVTAAVDDLLDLLPPDLTSLDPGSPLAVGLAGLVAKCNLLVETGGDSEAA